MEWVIVRPGGLKSDPATGCGVLTTDTTVCGAITREDVADLVIKALLSDGSNGKVCGVVGWATVVTLQQVLSAVDKEQLFGAPEFEVVTL